MFQAKSYSPVCSTARAADTASPPPFISMASKYGLLASWYFGLILPRTRSPGLNSSNRYGPVPIGARFAGASRDLAPMRSEEHTSELQSLMRILYAVFFL